MAVSQVRTTGFAARRAPARRSRASAQPRCAAASVSIPKVDLAAGGSTATAFPLGACVTAWTPAGTDRDVLYCRPDAKFDGSKPISGGVPHCFPQFGPGAMQQHGFARNLEWTVASSSDSSVTFELVDSEYTREMWDFAFKCTYTAEVAASALTCTLTVDNLDDKDFDFTASFHTYFSVESLPDVKVLGLEGLKVLDRVADSEGTQDGPVTIGGPVDSVYYGAPADLTLEVGGDAAPVKLSATGWTDAVVWNPWTDMENCYQEFVCVENACVGEPVVVKAGESWTASTVISV